MSCHLEPQRSKGITGKDVQGDPSCGGSSCWLLAGSSAKLLTRVSVRGASTCCGLVTAQQLDSNREYPERECPERECSRGQGRNCKASLDLASEVISTTSATFYWLQAGHHSQPILKGGGIRSIIQPSLRMAKYWSVLD